MQEWINLNFKKEDIYGKLGTKHIVEVHNSKDFSDEFFKYGELYFSAAELIIEKLIDEENSRNFDIHGIVLLYIYRHSLELMIKANVLKLIKESKEQIISKIGHKLSVGFLELNDIFEKIKPLEKRKVKWLINYFSIIDEFDESSDVFRYPRLFNGESTIKDECRAPLRELKRNMRVAFRCLKSLYQYGDFNKINLIRNQVFVLNKSDEYESAVIGYKNAEKKHYPYFHSYFEEAQILEKWLMNKNEQLFLPMCFLYRTAIELGLKTILYETVLFDENSAKEIIRKNKHSLLGLWHKINDELKSDGFRQLSDNEIEEIEKFEMYIMAIHNLDYRSDAFRYPTDKNMKFFFEEKRIFNIEGISHCFKVICNFLDAVSYKYDPNVYHDLVDYY